MRVVVDTNVFISAALKENSLPFLVVRFVERNGILLKSTETETELLAVLQRPKISELTTPAFRQGIATLLASAEAVEVKERFAVCRDPKDDKILQLAVNGSADVVVSGDADLLTLSPFRRIPIVPPATFVREWIG